MRPIFISLLLLWPVVRVLSQDTSRLTVYSLPAIHTPMFDFENVENTFSLLPLNGGLYCPENSSWYAVPGDRNFISVSYTRKDSSVSFSVRSEKGSYILTNRVGAGLKKMTDSTWLPDAGLYFVKRLNKDTLIYGGLTNGYYSVYQLIKNKSSLLFSFKGSIINFQVKTVNSLFFQAGNRIYYFEKGYKPSCIYSSQHNIDGFGFDAKMNLYISRKEGIFKMKRETASLVLPFTHGPLKINGNCLYVLSLQESEFIRLRL